MGVNIDGDRWTEWKASDAGMVLDAVFENSTVQDRPWIRTILEDWGFREG